MHRWLVLCLVMSGCASAPAQDTLPESPTVGVPDAAAVGDLASELIAFDAGYLLVEGSQGLYPVRVHGEATVPDGDGPFPLVVVMHGRHTTCRYLPGTAPFENLGNPCPDAAPVMEPVDSYTGYRGLAQMLASHGMAVVSVSANDINDYDNPMRRYVEDDSGATARGHLALEVVRGIRDQDDAYPFAQRIDTQRIGLMGHSRGGEGVARAAILDQQGPGFGIDAVFALAPTDFARWQLQGVAFGTILPYCDGDVSNLQGAWMYDDAGSPKHQFLHMGANHNYYNTVWTGDDWGSRDDPYCSFDGNATGRLSPEEQREQGYAVMSAFFRHYIGGEAGFWPLLEGSVRFPFPVHTSSHYEMGHTQSTVISPDGLAQATGAKASACTGTACPIPRTMAAAEMVHVTLPANGTFAFPTEPDGTWTYTVRMGLHPETSADALAGLSIVLSDAGRTMQWRLEDHGLFVPPGDDAAKTTLNMLWLPLDRPAEGMQDATLAITSTHEVQLQFTDWYGLRGPREGPLVDEDH